jgi:regulator of protease activity HflC (stomatin/prohibitin superfamily)
MGISSALGFIALAGWVAVVAGIGLAVAAASQNRSPRSGVILAVLGVIVGILFSVVSQGVIIVQPQQMAVIFDQISGQLLEPRGPGIHIVVPVVQEVTYYSIAPHTYTMSARAQEGQVLGDDAVEARTADGQQVGIDATIIYSIDPAQVNTVHRRWQQNYENGLIRPTVRGVIREIIARYEVRDIYSTGTEAATNTAAGEAAGTAPSELVDLRAEIQSAIAERLASEGFLVTDFLLRDIQFSDAFAASIEQKVVAEQNRQRAEQEAEQLRVQAAGERDAAITRANGEAQAVRIRAEAEAAALEMINAQISQNPNLIQWRFVETLSDNIQLMLLPSSSPFLFDFGSLASGSLTPSSSATSGTSESTPAAGGSQ